MTLEELERRCGSATLLMVLLDAALSDEDAKLSVPEMQSFQRFSEWIVSHNDPKRIQHVRGTINMLPLEQRNRFNELRNTVRKLIREAVVTLAKAYNILEPYLITTLVEYQKELIKAKK